MKTLILVSVLLVGCSATAQSRRMQIEAAEDKFCSLRAKEKQVEQEYGLTGEAGDNGQ